MKMLKSFLVITGNMTKNIKMQVYGSEYFAKFISVWLSATSSFPKIIWTTNDITGCIDCLEYIECFLRHKFEINYKDTN